jgi:hypothetical protein
MNRIQRTILVLSMFGLVFGTPSFAAAMTFQANNGTYVCQFVPSNNNTGNGPSGGFPGSNPSSPYLSRGFIPPQYNPYSLSFSPYSSNNANFSFGY